MLSQQGKKDIKKILNFIYKKNHSLNQFMFMQKKFLG